MSNSLVTCGEIETDGGFEFRLLSDSLNQTLRDCEQSWHLLDGRLIADPSDPLRLIDPATAVRSDRLFTSRCVNLNHEIICDAPGLHFSRVTSFRVRNQTAVTPNSDDLNEVFLQHSDQLWWFLVVFIILVLLVLMCFTLRGRIFRCFVKAVPCLCQREDSENRYPESDEI